MTDSRQFHSFGSPQEVKYKARQFSTADKYSNLELTAQKVQELVYQNEALKNFLAQFGITSPEQIQEIITRNSGRTFRMSQQSAGQELMKWDLSQRNQYLRQKIKKLKRQKQKQTESINKIKNTQKWRNKSSCDPVACYQKKYMRLLRIRCPATYF